jgi:integrase
MNLESDLDIARLGRGLAAIEGAFPRQAVLFRALALSGLRAGELLGLDWADIIPEGPALRLRSKSG